MFEDIFGFDDIIEAPSKHIINEDAQQGPITKSSEPAPPVTLKQDKWGAAPDEVWSTKDKLWNNENNQKLWEV